jgi:hypothetical protein
VRAEAEPHEYRQFVRECIKWTRETVRRDSLRGHWGSRQHLFSPQIEVRPEIAYNKSLDAAAFNGNAIALVAQKTNHEVIGAAHMITHF